MKYLLILLIAFNVNAAKPEEKTNWVTKLLRSDNQEYTHQATNKWVKYSGGLGFGYPYKTTPQAIHSKGVTYYTYSKCVTASTTNYMIVFIADNLGNKTVLRRIYSTKCDPHENAAIHVDEQGYITVAQSARGKWRKGYIMKSVLPNNISEFKTIDSGFYAYPKLDSNGMVYTDYNGALRETWVKNEQCNKQLVNGGGYAITTEVNGETHMLYNYHYAGNLDSRVNLYYMWSSNGCDWFNRHGESLQLPANENSQLTAIDYDYHKFNYLKDIRFIDGEIMALVVQSTSSDPTKGQRELLLVNMHGDKKVITNMGHNYDGAQFWKGNIIVVKNNKFGYAGGDLLEYSLGGEYIGSHSADKANYPVAVKGSDSLMFADSNKIFIVE